MLSDVTSAWQLYFGLMFIGVVLFAPERRRRMDRCCICEAARAGELWRLAPAYAAVGPALAASGAGAIMIIELANRQLADGAQRRFGDASLRLRRRRVVDRRPGSSRSCCSPAATRPRSDGSGRGSTTPGAPSTSGFSSRGAGMTAALSLIDRRKNFGPVQIIRGVSLEIAEGRAARDHRPERRRQIDAVSISSAAASGRRSGEVRLHGERITGLAAVRDQPPRPVAQLSDHQHLSQDCRSTRICAARRSGRSATNTRSGRRSTGCATFANARNG